MYILNKLEEIAGLYDDENTDGVLAKYFLHHLDNIMTINSQKCKEDTGVSRASLHRFYSKAGFNSLKDFLIVLDEEYFTLCQEKNSHKDYANELYESIQACKFDEAQIHRMIIKLQKASQVVFYGNVEEIYLLHTFIHTLRVMHKEVIILNNWKYEKMIEAVENMDKDDVFILVDTNMRIQNYHETSMNFDYLISLQLLNDTNMHKYFIGKATGQKYLSFHNIRVPSSKASLLLLDQDITERM